MKTQFRLCPVALYIGRWFQRHRIMSGNDLERMARHIECAVQILQDFEEGVLPVDALLLFKLEKFYRVRYSDYKPPVSYFGFLSITACENQMLAKTKITARHAKRHFQHPNARCGIENALLKLRYAPLRGAVDLL